MNSHTGAIVILAYPEEFVSMIPAWYRKPLEWIGMVNHGKIAAGHAAMALINKETGEVHYGDFGRYITRFGYGRTRMAPTDPDVKFDYIAEFKSGEIVDKIALFEHIFNHPEKTHGGDVMYTSLNQNIDFEKCYDFMTTMNSKGSIIYDPFGKGRSNCSRFVFDSILSGMTNESSKRKLRRKSPVTSSPLGNVFHGTEEESYVFKPSGYEIVKDKSIRVVLKHLFKKAPAPLGNSESEEQLQEKFLGLNPNKKWSYLGGVGDQAYILLDEVKDSVLKIKKFGQDHSLTFENSFTKHDDFDPQAEFEFIHDCNAAWITVKQEGKTIKMEAIS